ncbi:Uncharacterised protein [Salmonella enterica subsp. enterica]|nr:Uncharacterised protein [Salmonella enterica subsp. enterica] [Salmonella enterica subsp. enterica serovar Singapore]VEA25311.1 Uncharacterised protein [Salmonella enterica subsp. enterica]
MDAFIIENFRATSTNVEASLLGFAISSIMLNVLA